MATLTPAQMAYIRDMSGDDKADNAEVYEVSDATLQAIYDDATQGDGNLDYTVVHVLRRRVGKAARLVSLSGEFGNAAYNQKFDNLRKLLAYWEARTGLASEQYGGLEGGGLNLGIDARPENEWG